MTHEELVQAAKDAINAVFSDTTVPQSTTMESLEELEAEIEVSIQALREDMEKDQ